MWGWGLCVVEVTLSRWSLCLRWCVSLHQSILPILAPVTCYTPSPRNKYLTWSICPKYLTWNICQMICSICNFLVLQDYVYDSFNSCPISYQFLVWQIINTCCRFLTVASSFTQALTWETTGMWVLLLLLHNCFKMKQDNLWKLSQWEVFALCSRFKSFKANIFLKS